MIGGGSGQDGNRVGRQGCHPPGIERGCLDDASGRDDSLRKMAERYQRLWEVVKARALGQRRRNCL